MAPTFNRLCEEVLQEWLGRRLQFNAVFDSSECADPMKDFHEQCDSCGPNVTVFHCTNNSMIGAFTTQDWKPQDCMDLPFKTDNKAFLFKMFNNGIFEPRQYLVNNACYATFCNTDCGPAFGLDRGRREIETRRVSNRHRAGAGKVEVVCSINDTFALDRESQRLLERSLLNISKFQVFQILDDDSYIDKEWRNVSDVSVESLKSELIQERPRQDSNGHFELLLVGQIGAGKSSFINSVRSAFKGYVSSSICTGSDRTSLTMENTAHVIRNQDGSKLHFRIWDTKGLEADTLKSQENNVTHIITGQPSNWMMKMFTHFASYWQKNTTSNVNRNKIHCVAFVVDGTSVNLLSNEIRDTFNNIRRFSINQGIPQVVLLTKVDQVCPMVYQHPALTFHSKAVMDVVDETADLLGISRLNILPVKNYEHECELETAIDRLTLLSIRQMIRLANDSMDGIDV